MRTSLIKVAAAGALFMGVDIPGVLAASVTQPGETAGAPPANPFRRAYISPIQQTGAAGPPRPRILVSALRFRSSLGRRLGRCSARGCNSFR